MSDPSNLQRFIDGQEGVYTIALAELRRGSKQSHWMWFIFPQLRGLGHSSTARFYGIASLGEARTYLDNPLLGRRLRECVEAILLWSGKRSPEQILGAVDTMKLRSCLTLFDAVEPDGIFNQALNAFYGGERDPRTLALLNGER